MMGIGADMYSAQVQRCHHSRKIFEGKNSNACFQRGLENREETPQRIWYAFWMMGIGGGRWEWGVLISTLNPSCMNVVVGVVQLQLQQPMQHFLHVIHWISLFYFLLDIVELLLFYSSLAFYRIMIFCF